jgi:hypothetical protein
VRADAVFLLVTPLTVVGQDVGHHFTSGGSGSGIQCVTSAHHSQRPCMYSLKDTSVAVIRQHSGFLWRQSLAHWYPFAHCVTRFASRKNKRKTYRFCHVSDTRKTAYAGK